MDKIRNFIKAEEGFRSVPYLCTEGYWTAGWGHNFDAHGEPVPAFVTNDTAEEYLTADIDNASRDARSVVSSYNWLNDARRAVMISMAFQLGRRGLSTFTRMIAAINKGHYNLAAHEMLDSKAFRQTPGRIARQALMLATGNWPGEE